MTAKAVLLISFVVSLGVVLMGCGPPPPPPPGPTPTPTAAPTPTPKATLDHFKVWEAGTVDFDKVVTLEDQFDRKNEKPETAKLLAVTHFANPVSKNDEALVDKLAHLVWYKYPGSVKGSTVELENQFGKQEWELGISAYLLVPTQKKVLIIDNKEIETKLEFPAKLDHFKCYQVTKGESVPKDKAKVILEDQIDRHLQQKEQMETLKPMYFCNPVVKEGKHGIINEKDHLACYDIEPKTELRSPIEVKFWNQFGDSGLRLLKSVMLCAPSTKRVKQ